MLNENKIKMMTKMAIYEKNEGKSMLKTAKYFKSDFVTLGILKTVIASMLAYIVIVILYILCNIEYLAANINSIDYASLGLSMLGYYLAFIVVFAVIAGIVYSVRYESTRNEMKKYFSRLNKLEKYYANQRRKK